MKNERDICVQRPKLDQKNMLKHESTTKTLKGHDTYRFFIDFSQIHNYLI